MKKLFIPLVSGLLLSCATQPARAQEFKTHVSKTIALTGSASSSVLSVYNIFGAIKVEGYAGDKVLFEVDQTIRAKDDAMLERGKQEVQLAFERVGDTVWAYTASPDDSRPHRQYTYTSHWDDEDEKKDRKERYHYELAYTIKVPFGMNINVSTVNGGNISIKDVAGRLRVRNVNGAIDIINAKNTTDAKTINGHLTVNYLVNPKEASTYYTLNGKLTVTYQPDLSADLQFKSLNGQFYTDFPDVEILPKTVTKTQDKKGDGVLYKLNKNSDVRIGAGGKTFKFETLNGNIYIQKQS